MALNLLRISVMSSQVGAFLLLLVPSQLPEVRLDPVGPIDEVQMTNIN